MSHSNISVITCDLGAGMHPLATSGRVGEGRKKQDLGKWSWASSILLDGGVEVTPSSHRQKLQLEFRDLGFVSQTLHVWDDMLCTLSINLVFHALQLKTSQS